MQGLANPGRCDSVTNARSRAPKVLFRVCNMTSAADVKNVALAYVEDIERLVAEDFLTDALKKLLDFVRDFAPSLKKDALALYASHSRVRKSLKHGTGE